MAHKKGAGSSDNGRDSISKRLGVKLFGGQVAVAGNIIVRQRGTRFHPGENVYMGKDHTLHAAIDGLVRFKKGYKDRNFVFIEPVDEVLAKRDAAPKSPKAKASAPKAPVAPKKAAPAKAPAATAKVEVTKTETVVSTPTVEAVKTTVTETVVATPVVEEEKAAVSETIETTSTTVTTTTVTTSSSSSSTETVEFSGTPDDLKKVEGIGPKIEGLLNEAGIMTWAQLSKTSVDRIKEILAAAGGRYATHNPGTWPYQAKLAAEGAWDELKDYQDILDGGVTPE